MHWCKIRRTNEDRHLWRVEKPQESLWDDLEHASLESFRLLGDLHVEAVVRHQDDVLHAVFVRNGDLGSVRNEVDGT